MTTVEHGVERAGGADGADALAERVFQACLGAQDLVHIYLGDKLGLYDALGSAPLTPLQLASRAGIAPRYAREWLEQQACSGFLDLAEPSDDPEARRYHLSGDAARVLSTPDSLYFLAPLAQLFVGATQALPQVLQAFRTGAGVPYEAFGADVRAGIERGNRPMFLNQLAYEWIPALPDIQERLRRTDPPALVADLACGSGWSSIALALAFPSARVDGIDLDTASIAAATRNAASEGVSRRVTFAARDADDPALAGRYDLVTIFEALHDMAHPATVLSAARTMLAPGGCVLVADERVAETFAAPGSDIDRFNYGWSAVHCLPAALASADRGDSAAIGTVIRPSTVRRLAEEAGFASVTVLPVEHDLWRFYRLDP